MADNTRLSAGTADGVIVAGAVLSFGGDSALHQVISGGFLTGSEGSWAYTLSAAGTGVDSAGVQRVSLATDVALPAGDNNIGNVDIVTLPAGNLGARAMVASLSTTIATDDTHFGAVGAASDADGVVHGQLRYIGENIDEVHIPVDSIDAIASWAASTDASGIAQETDNVPSHAITTSLSIAKTGTATSEASYGKTLGATVDASVLAGDALALFYVRHTTWTNVTNVFVRLGTDASNYVEFGFDPADFSTTLWTQVTIQLHEGSQTGTGLDLANIDYAAFGFTTTASGNTVSDVFFNAVEIHSVSTSDVSITSDVSASTVRVSKIGSNSNQTAATGAGAVTSGTQRNTLASDDPAVVSLALLDNAVSGAGYNITQFGGAAVPIGGGTEAGALRVTIANDSTGVVTVDGAVVATGVATDGAAFSGKFHPVGGVDGGGDAYLWLVNASGIGSVNVASFPQALLDQQVSASSLSVTPATDIAAQTYIGDVANIARATGGASFFKSIDLDESEEQIKGSAATFYGGIVMNLKASVLYLKIYDALAANVTVGTTAPDLTIPIPTQGDTNGAGFVIPIPACGLQFATGLTVACTTGIADNDNGAPGANECAVALWFE